MKVYIVVDKKTGVVAETLTTERFGEEPSQEHLRSFMRRLERLGYRLFVRGNSLDARDLVSYVCSLEIAELEAAEEGKALVAELNAWRAQVAGEPTGGRPS